MHRTNRFAAFTLIELLIVVAIIAILAAIAVPNFLEAQVRAKVSRAKSDMRTIATALESYNVDTNAYPEQGTPTDATFPFSRDVKQVYGGDGPDHTPGNPAIAFRLSTPIAYLASTTAVFSDPFFRGFRINQTSVVNDTRYYNYSGDYYKGRIYDSTQDGDIATYGARVNKLNQINHWHLRSRGPDSDYERRSAGWEEYLEFHGAAGTGTSGSGGVAILYDATNGTVSNGDIVRFGTDGVKN